MAQNLDTGEIMEFDGLKITPKADKTPFWNATRGL